MVFIGDVVKERRSESSWVGGSGILLSSFGIITSIHKDSIAACRPLCRVPSHSIHASHRVKPSDSAVVDASPEQDVNSNSKY